MSQLKRFASDTKGGVLPMFAVAIVPLFGFMGAAIDYSRASAARSEMQASIDAVTIMLAKEANKLTAEQINTKANDYFKAMYNRPEAKDITLTPVFTTTDGVYSMKISASASLSTQFMNVMGVSKMDIASNSEVTWGSRKLELALALDNTGSMAANSKMDELKKASKSLLDTLKKSAITPDSAKVAIIPFATDVNVGVANANAAWLDWSDWDAKNGAMVPVQTCTYKKNGKVDTCTTSMVWQPNPHNTWNGCVWDRDKPYDGQDAVPDNKSRMFQPHQANNCPAATLPLTSVSTGFSALNAKIDAMIPTGNTNVTIGLSWAWHALTASEPMKEAAAPAKDLDKVIILLTDGTNTANRWDADANSIDARTKHACDNVKAAGIKLYTVRVIDGNAAMLQSCASDPSMYYDVQNAGTLISVFGTIAENLASLRIAK